MKKLIKNISIVILIALISGCSLKNKEEKNSKYKISFVTDKFGFEENGHNMKIKEGLMKLKEQANIKVYNSKSKEEYIEDLKTAAEDSNLVVAASGLLNDAVKSVSNQNPKVKFLVVDSFVETENKNVKSIMFKNNEAAFLAGYLAGYTTKTNKVGYIGMKKGFINDNYEYGFLSGVNYAAKERKIEIKISAENIEDILDYELGKKTASKMYDENIDIIYQAAGNAGLGAVETAKNRNKNIIGNHTEQFNLAKNNFIASTIKKYDEAIKYIATKYISEEQFKDEIFLLGLKENSVDLINNNENDLHTNEIYNKILLIKEKIIKKEILVPFDSETYLKKN